MTKCQITCRSHQKSSKCQNFLRVWHFFRADQSKKPHCIFKWIPFSNVVIPKMPKPSNRGTAQNLRWSHTWNNLHSALKCYEAKAKKRPKQVPIQDKLGLDSCACTSDWCAQIGLILEGNCGPGTAKYEISRPLVILSHSGHFFHRKGGRGWKANCPY